VSSPNLFQQHRIAIRRSGRRFDHQPHLYPAALGPHRKLADQDRVSGGNRIGLSACESRYREDHAKADRAQLEDLRPFGEIVEVAGWVIGGDLDQLRRGAGDLPRTYRGSSSISGPELAF
jgi:hypothetical protein